MYFYKDKDGQHLDMTGNFIISHNDAIVKARSSSAKPKTLKNIKYVTNVGKLSFIKKVITTLRILAFIWGADKSLRPDMTNKREPIRNEPPVDYDAQKSGTKF